jgi:DNA polymerase (family 10)
MTAANADIATIFATYADLLEIGGANPFRVRAYRRAAMTIDNLPHSMAEMVQAGEDLSKLPGIGKELAAKIAEIVETGHLHNLDELEKSIPGELARIVALPGIGPKRVGMLHDELGIETLEQLEAAAKAGRISTLRGFGAKTERRILEALAHHAGAETRIRLAAAEEVARPLMDYLANGKGVARVVVAGSYRRRRETVGDLDILVTCPPRAKVMDRFVAHPDVAEVVSKGGTRSTVRLRSGLQVDLRVVPDASYGAALHYFTGSKAHNIAIRRRGVERGLKINEYGVFRGKTRIGWRTEEEVFAAVGLPYIEPELREDRGEIAAAEEGRLPRLVTVADIRGDLHCHTKASDGTASLEEIAAAAMGAGYQYLAITDHSKHVTIAHGLDDRAFRRQAEEIDRLNERLDGIRLLKSAEVDILKDGSLDLADATLAELDMVVGAVHYGFGLPAAQQTDRLIRAMDNPHFTILAHPSGRLLGERPAYALDMERLLRAALERGCVLEVNAQPKRLDLTDVYCRAAKDMGLKLAISTDTHHPDQLAFMRFGVDQARRGWLEPGDVVNTRSWPDLKRLLARS